VRATRGTTLAAILRLGPPLGPSFERLPICLRHLRAHINCTPTSHLHCLHYCACLAGFLHHGNPLSLAWGGVRLPLGGRFPSPWQPTKPCMRRCPPPSRRADPPRGIGLGVWDNLLGFVGGNVTIGPQRCAVLCPAHPKIWSKLAKLKKGNYFQINICSVTLLAVGKTK
jgi:hypothetical protein